MINLPRLNEPLRMGSFCARVCVQAALIVAGKHMSLGRRSLALTWWQLARLYGHVETLQDAPLLKNLSLWVWTWGLKRFNSGRSKKAPK